MHLWRYPVVLCSICLVVAVMAAACATGPEPGEASAVETPSEHRVEIDPPDSEFLQQASQHDWSYQFRSGTWHGRPALEVLMHLETGVDANYTDLVIPREWDNVTDYSGIVDLQVVGDSEATLQSTSDEYVGRLSHEPGASVTVGYRVIPDYDQLTIDEHRMPTVDEEHFVADGQGLFVAPDREETLRHEVLLDWSRLPDSWEVANSLGLDERRQSRLQSIAELQNHTFVGGEYETHATEHQGVPLRVLVHDKWSDSMDELVESIAQLKSSAHDLFGEHDHDFVLIVAHPLDQPAPYRHGLAGTNSVRLWFGDDADLTSKWSLVLASHELIHLWNGTTLSPGGEDRHLFAWFFEGFTDYYAARLLIREGLIDLEDYLVMRNQDLFEYEVSPMINIPNEKVAEMFWQDTEALRIPYLRGSILAMTWDASIRQNTEYEASLDDIMSTLMEQARAEELELDWELITDVVESVWEEGLEDIETVIQAGQEIIPHHQALGPCVEPAIAQAGPYEPGFDIDASADAGEIRGVVADSPAYHAGLRNGQRLLGWELYRPDERQIAAHHFEVELLIGENTRRTVRYLPTSEPERVRQFSLDEERYEEDPDQCLEWFRSY